jgi:tripartite-type tricarboxylate transporter receptor subunit TctC
MPGRRIGRASVGLVDDRDYVAALKRLSFVPRSAAPQEFATLIAEEHRRWAPIFADLKLQ